MKKTGYVFIAAIICVLAFSLVTYTSCTRDRCAGYTCYNGGSCYNGNCSCPSGFAGYHCELVAQTGITYQNDTYTPIYITVNGSNDVIPVGGTITYTGTYGDQLTGNASTSGTTTSGSVVGQTIQWNLNATFPSSGTSVQYLDVTQDYFYLKIVNTSSYTIQTVYVNYGLAAQTVDYISLPNDGHVYGIGYYEAYTNSNARFESGANSWSFNSLGLPFTSNQSVTLTAN